MSGFGPTPPRNDSNKTDIEGHYLRALDCAPEFRDRILGAKRADRFYGMAVPNFFRKPFGPGWALVGDAGYNKGFNTAQRMSDAFRDAERCVDALDGSFSGTRTFDAAMGAYQAGRDEHVLPIYEFTRQFASFVPLTPEMQQLFGAIRRRHVVSALHSNL